MLYLPDKFSAVKILRKIGQGSDRISHYLGLGRLKSSNFWMRQDGGFGGGLGFWKSILNLLPVWVLLVAHDLINQILAIELNSRFCYQSVFFTANRVSVKIYPRQDGFLGYCT